MSQFTYIKDPDYFMALLSHFEDFKILQNVQRGNYGDEWIINSGQGAEKEKVLTNKQLLFFFDKWLELKLRK